jgi:hypothetical protein
LQFCTGVHESTSGAGFVLSKDCVALLATPVVQQTVCWWPPGVVEFTNDLLAIGLTPEIPYLSRFCPISFEFCLPNVCTLVLSFVGNCSVGGGHSAGVLFLQNDDIY